MGRLRYSTMVSLVVLLLLAGSNVLAAQTGNLNSSEREKACQALANIRNLTVLSANLVAAKGATPEYCYVRGLIAPAIHFHVQLPLPANWNGRFLKWGYGGKDGDLGCGAVRHVLQSPQQRWAQRAQEHCGFGRQLPRHEAGFAQSRRSGAVLQARRALASRRGWRSLVPVDAPDQGSPAQSAPCAF